MKFNIKFHVTIVTAFFVFIFSGFMPLERNIESVSKLLPGSWRLVDVVENPGQPLLQSEEELQLQRIFVLSSLKTSDPLIFQFSSNNKVAIQYPKSNNEKLSGKTISYKWQLLENGDLLEFIGPKKSKEQYKILIINEKELELLVQTSYFGSVLLNFERQ